jgi:anionic cell wall polymer biosynthesis LytR-Cps2A-Psr (LCP) family protein
LAARALADQAEEILGIEIQYFVHINWQALVQIVDALGGIDVAFVYKGTSWAGDEVAIETLDKRGLKDYWDVRTQTWLVDYKNGEVVHLNGEQALGVARSRNAYGGYGSGSNFGREQFQQKIIQAAIMKAKATNFATDFMAALSIKGALGDNLRMDFKDIELKTLFRLMGKIDMEGMQSVPLQDMDDGSSLLASGSLQASNGEWYSYVYPVAGVGNYAAVHAYIARKLSTDPVMSENAKILVMNATSASGVAASEGNRLKDKGFNVIQNTNAPSALGAVEGVKIYQKNQSMSGTAKMLEKFYNIVVSTTIPDVLTNYLCDFIVVLGDGFAAVEH